MNFVRTSPRAYARQNPSCTCTYIGAAAGARGGKGDGASRKKGCQKADSGERAIKSR